MQWRGERDALRSAVEVARPAVGRSFTLPVLSCLRLDATDDGTLSVTGSDLDLTISTIAKGETADPGCAVVPAGVLSSWLAKVPAGAVELVADADGVTLSVGGSALNLRSPSVDEWPNVPEVDGEAIVIDGETWERWQRIAPFADTDGLKPHLCVLRLDEKGAWTTDTFRLGWVPGSWPVEASIPTECLRAIAKVGGGALSMQVDANHARFIRDDTTWTQRLAIDDFPRGADRYFTGEHLLSIEVDREELKDALARTQVIARGKTAWPTVLRWTGDELAVTNSDDDIGEASESVPATVEGDPHVAFRSEYLADLLASVGDRPTLRGTDANKPWVCDHDGISALLMPVRLPS